MSVELETEINIDEKIEELVLDPGKYKVIMLNDDATPMDFVVEILVGVFRHSVEVAEAITMEIHKKGSAVVGTYIFEIAEQKAVETTKLSRANGFPLQTTIEKEQYKYTA